MERKPAPVSDSRRSNFIGGEALILQCHSGKVHTYVDSLAAAPCFFGVLTMLITSSFINKCHEFFGA